MNLFQNPECIESLSAASWDWEVQNALLHARGQGIQLPEPEVRYWTFPNGLGAAARLSRDMILAYEICYDVWVFVPSGGPAMLAEKDLLVRGLPLGLAPRENLLPEEVDEFLAQVQTCKIPQRGGGH